MASQCQCEGCYGGCGNSIIDNGLLCQECIACDCYIELDEDDDE